MPPGDHWKRKRDALGIPSEKECENCGRVFTRYESREQTLSHWIKRRFCSNACRRRGTARLNSGKASVHWKGDAVSENAWRRRARQLYPVEQPCEVCGATEHIELHHRDHNPKNNAPENIAWLCRRHHHRVHQGNPERRARIEAMHASGCRVSEIARAEGIGHSTVVRYLQRAAGDDN